MSESLGTIRGQMILDVKQALASYTAVRQQHVSTVTALATGGGAIATSGAVIAGAGLAMGAGLIHAANAAAEFERKLDYFTAVGGPDAAKNYDAVRDKALQLGQDTIYSAGQIADSFVELAKSGVGAKDIIAGIGEGVAALGAAADIPLDTAANIITAAVATFHLGAGQAVSVADQLAGAANASIVDVQDLGVSLKYAGGVASALKIPFKDVNTALAILGTNGIKGSTAGTSLRQVLLGLNGSTKKAKTELKNLGIITADGTNKFYNANGSAKSLADVFQILQNATKGYSDKQKLATFQTIFATRALPSLIALTGAGAKGFQQMYGEISKTTALNVSTERLDNLSGDIEILRGNIETLQVVAGMKMQTFARGLVQGITAIVGAITNMPAGMMQAIIVVIGLASAISIAVGAAGIFAGSVLNILNLAIRAGPALTALRGAVVAVTVAVKGFALAAAGALGPWGIVLVILSLIATALTIFFTQTTQGKAMWQQLMTLMQGTITQLMPLITSLAQTGFGLLTSALRIIAPILQVVAQVFTQVFGPILTVAATALGQVAAAFSGVGASASGFTGIGQIITGVFQGIITAIPIIITAITRMVVMIVTTLVGMAPALISGGIQLLNGLITAVVTVLPLVVQAVLQLITSLVTALAAQLPVIVNAGLTLLSGIITAILQLLPVIIAAVIQLIITIVTALISMVPVLLNAAIQIFTTLVQALPIILPQLINAIVNGIIQLITMLVAMIPTLLNAAITLFMSLVNAVIKILPKLLVTIVNLIPKIIVTLISLIPILLNAAITLFTALVKAIPKIIPPLISGVIGLIPKIISALISLIPQLISAAIKLFMAIVQAIPQIVGALVSALVNLGGQMIQGLVNGLKNAGGAVLNAIGGIVNGAVNWAKGLLGIKSPSRVFMSIGKYTIMGLINGISAMGPQLNRQMTSVVNQLTDFYDQVGAAASMDAQLNVIATSSTDSTTLAQQFDALNAQLAEIADKDTFNVDKIEINNPQPEPASDSLPDSIRKVTYMVGS